MVIVKLIMNKPIFAKKTGWQGTKKNGASIKKIFRSEHCERKVFNTFRRQEKFCDIALVSSDGTMRYVVMVHSRTLTATKQSDHKFIFRQNEGASNDFGSQNAQNRRSI